MKLRVVCSILYLAGFVTFFGAAKTMVFEPTGEPTPPMIVFVSIVLFITLVIGAFQAIGTIVDWFTEENSQ